MRFKTLTITPHTMLLALASGSSSYLDAALAAHVIDNVMKVKFNYEYAQYLRNEIHQQLFQNTIGLGFDVPKVIESGNIQAQTDMVKAFQEKRPNMKIQFEVMGKRDFLF